ECDRYLNDPAALETLLGAKAAPAGGPFATWERLMESELHVIFGTAALGQAVMRQLVCQGKRVRMVSRSGKIAAPVEAVSPQVEVARGDAADPASTREVCRGAAVVYHCAAPPYTEWAEKYPPIQAGITEGADSLGAKL